MANTQSTDFLPLNGTNHLEFYVGNAKQAAPNYQTAFGFTLVAYAGPETGNRASYVLQQGKVRILLTSTLLPSGEITQHVQKHGDGVKVLALWIDDAEKSFRETEARGAKPTAAPQTVSFQKEKYLYFYHSPGIQQIAVATPDILTTVAELRNREVAFSEFQEIDYQNLGQRVGQIEEDRHALRDVNIIVDRDEEGYLLQIFTKPVQDRPTLFYQFIQRKGAKSFG